jgi:signal transduction histidine kinase
LIKEYFSAKEIVLQLERESMSEVFTNLLSNALKFTGKGEVTVAVIDKGDFVECFVQDMGVGIPEKDIPNVFSKFTQFNRPIDSQEKGSGLGLYIVKGIVERHGGHITVSSGADKGTRFTFTLPKTAAEVLAEAK